jgi:hypothetical protein
MMEPAERLAILETKLEQVEESNEKILARLEQMQSDLTRFKGFAGGMLFVASAIGAFLGVLKAWVLGPH